MKELTKADQIVVDQIITYISDDRYKQAVLLDGEWGCGKTYFVTNILQEQIHEKLSTKSVLYVSLYGLSNPNQIIEEVYGAYAADFINKKARKKVGKVTVNGANILAKIISTGADYFNIDMKKLPKLSDIVALQNVVIIFDDLERCEIEINQTLGIINNFVEHQNIKVIIVANQNEIGRALTARNLPDKYSIALNSNVKIGEKDSGKYSVEELKNRTTQFFNEGELYNGIKEKLIGLTIYYHAEFREVFNSIIDECISDKEEVQFLKGEKDAIIAIFNKYNHQNIRTFVNGLIAFDKFYEVVSDIECKDKGQIIFELKRVLQYTMISSIKIKSGMKSYNWDKNNLRTGLVYYEGGGLYGGVFGYSFVDEYLLKCKLEKSAIIEIISSLIKERVEEIERQKKNKTLHLPNLTSWWTLEDDEISLNVEKVKEELQNGEYNYTDFKSIIVSLLQVNSHGFTFNIEEFVEVMVKAVEATEDLYETHIFQIVTDDSDFQKQYNEMLDPLYKTIEKKKKVDSENKNKYLNDKDEWNNEFSSRCFTNKDEYVKLRKFFYYISPDEFINQLSQAKTKQICNFSGGISNVYSFANLNHFFQADLNNLKGICCKIDVEEMSQGKITRKLALERLKEDLQIYIRRIEGPT